MPENTNCRPGPPRPRRVLLGALGAAIVVATACGGRGAPPEPTARAPLAEDEPSRVLLVSIDGFRADYLEPKLTPNLARLARRGVRAEALIPSFPTKTFPNHYSIVTGLRPDRHGLVANNIWDPEMRDTYGLGDREAVGDARWYGGVPVWVTAERRGLATAPLFWPGSEAPIDGVRPTYWTHYDGEMPHRARVDWVLDRMAGVEGAPARFATLYFEDVDTAGHEHGPGAPETRAAVARVDSAVGHLLDELAARSLEDVNLVVVSDHGMSQLSRDRVIFLDDYLDPEATMVVDWSPVLAVWPDSGEVEEVYETLEGRHPHLRIYRPEEIPERYHFGRHDRVAPIVGIADPGWSITTRDYFVRNPERFDGGNHGYYQRAEEMAALFVASGPAFREGVVLDSLLNVDVYELIMAVLDLPAAPGDGSLERASAALVPAEVPAAAE